MANFDYRILMKRILLVVAINLLFLASAVAVYAFGYEYDRRHNISQTICYGDLCIGTYGERWLHIAELITEALLLGDAVLIVMSSIRRPTKTHSIFSN